MGLRTIYRSPTAEDQAVPFCRCRLRSTAPLNRQQKIGDCHCAETDSTRMDWNFNNDDASKDGDVPPADIRITNMGTDILFHPVYSQGTAMIRACRPLVLQQNLIHYWEIKIMSCMSGTDTVSFCCAVKIYIIFSELCEAEKRYFIFVRI